MVKTKKTFVYLKKKMGGGTVAHLVWWFGLSWISKSKVVFCIWLR